jgi:hypothetical protein
LKADCACLATEVGKLCGKLVMVTINSIREAPSLGDFVRKVQQEESKLSYFEVPGNRLKLYDDGKLGIDAKDLSGRFVLSKKALTDLAQLADVHSSFFLNKCDNKLRSIIIDYLLPQKVSPEERLAIVLQDQEVVHSVQNSNLLFARRASILDTVSNAKPENVPKEDLKAIVYQWNGDFDVSIIAPTLNCQPKKDDTVAFGINVAQGRDGSVQVQSAAFRLACLNGAINRICDSRQHRLRRPINRPDGQSQFLARISVLAQEAWNQWSHQAEQLKKLPDVALDQNQATALRSRLRQAPFFLSLRVVNQILERLQFETAQHGGAPSVYDVWNVMTYLGFHQHRLSYTYRSRLRYGAGELTRHRSRVCSACQQLLLS